MHNHKDFSYLFSKSRNTTIIKMCQANLKVDSSLPPNLMMEIEKPSTSSDLMTTKKEQIPPHPRHPLDELLQPQIERILQILPGQTLASQVKAATGYNVGREILTMLITVKPSSFIYGRLRARRLPQSSTSSL